MTIQRLKHSSVITRLKITTNVRMTANRGTSFGHLDTGGKIRQDFVRQYQSARMTTRSVRTITF